MIIPSKLYDILKWVCLTAIPALIVFLNVLLPSVGVSVETTSTVTKIIGAIATFIGTLIGISTINYNKKDDIEIATDNVWSYVEDQSAESVLIKNSTKVEFHGSYYELTGKELQILASYSYSDETYDYVEYLYGDGQTSIKKSKAFKTDAEREAHYNKVTDLHPDWYPIKWSYDSELTLAQNFTIAKGQKTKEDFINK